MQLFDVLNLQLFKPLSGRYQRMFAELLMLIWDHCRTSTDYGILHHQKWKQKFRCTFLLGGKR